MRICVYAEFLASVPTSATACRGMLSRLLALRPEDEFTFFVRKGSERLPLFLKFLDGCSSDNYRVVTSGRPRWFCNLLGLFHYRNCHEVTERSDFYLGLDLDFMGTRATPSLYTVYDLSSVREPKHSSMAWHGVRLRRHALRLLAQSGSAVAASSEYTKKDLIRYDPSFRNRTEVIYCGIGDIWFEDGRPKAGASKSAKPYWIWYGYITRRKNIDGVLRAYAALIAGSTRPEVIPDLVLVGGLGKDSVGLPDLAVSLGLGTRVHWLPFQQNVSDLVDLVAGSSGLVFPSHFEGFGLPCIEAMALGLPVLLANKTCQPEIGGGFAVLCDPARLNSIADGLQELMSPAQVQPAAVEARQKWARRFTHEAAAREYSSLIGKIMGKRLCAGSRGL